MKVTLQIFWLIPFNIFLARISWPKNSTKYFSMKNFLIFLILFVFLFVSCAKNKPNIITYKLKRSDYLEKIDAIGTIQAVNNMVIMSPRVSASNLTVTYLADEGAYVKKGDTICILEAPDLVNSVESMNTSLENMEAEQQKLEADNAMQLATLSAQVETNKALMEITMLDSVQLKFAPPVKKKLISLEMEKANIEKKKLQKKISAQTRIDKAEVVRMNSRIMIQKNLIQQYQNQLNTLKITAPCDGFVIHYESPVMRFMSSMGSGMIGGKTEKGSVVWSNMTLLQIPDMKEMQVLVEVPEADYKRVKEKQNVLITVDAATNLATTGKVKIKKLSGTKTQQNSAVKTYEVIVSIDSCHSQMKPGLSAFCRIIVDQMKDTIVVPASAVFVKDSIKIVYVAVGEEFTPITVETGLSNSSKSIITRGLSGNETIALIEPPHNLIRKENESKNGKILAPESLKKDSVIKKSTDKELTFQNKQNE